MPEEKKDSKDISLPLNSQNDAESKQVSQNSFWNKAVAFLERLAKQHHVVALRDGMIASVPIILVGSTFLLLGAQGQIMQDYFAGQVSWLPNLVQSSFGKWYLDNTQLIYFPYRMTMGMLALYIAFTIASALAVQYKLPPVPQGLGAVAALLVTAKPFKAQADAASSAAWVLQLKPLGPEGIFLAIILAVTMVEISRILLRPQREAEKPQSSEQGEEGSKAVESSIPPSVLDAFKSFLPMLITVSIVWFVRHLLGTDIHALIQNLMEPMNRLGDSLAAVLATNFFMHLFAVAGIHGISIINAAMLPLWQQFVAANAEAHSMGLSLPHITAYPFYQWFIWIGGAGATLAPTVMLFFFKNKHLKDIAKISIVPALFNINEPFLFGLPVVANPLLAIPCIIAPLCCGTVSWFAFKLGLVSPPFIEVPWVMPCFLGAILSTQDWRSLVLLGVNMLISAAVWYPFLLVYRRKL